MIRAFVRRLVSIPTETRALITLKSVGDASTLKQHVPYQGQYPSLQSTRLVTEPSARPSNDPAWRSLGFNDKDDVDYWSPRACGACCVTMLARASQHDVTVADVVKQGVELGGYDIGTDQGWFYQPLTEQLKSYGYTAEVAPYLSITRLATHILGGGTAILSVNPQIIRGDDVVTNHDKSGHLVLAVGVDIRGGRVDSLTIHNPSGKDKHTRENATVSVDTLQRSYGRRGILVRG